jgi:D-alanine--poly(phosphoribitol) ligase subunit 1
VKQNNALRSWGYTPSMAVSGVPLVAPTRGRSEDVLGSVLRHATERPGALALQDDAAVFSYAELAARAGQLAAGLDALGAGPGERVALHLGNSAAFVTLALGCLWSGAAFVPLPTDSPPARLARMLADCRPAVVVARDRSGLGPMTEARVVTVDDLLLAASGSGWPPRSLDTGRDAYLIYTSGTTGVAKGVVIPERALRTSVGHTVELLGLDESTRSLVVSAFHFDGAYGVVFPTLVAGGSLTVPPREDMLFLGPFFDRVRRHQITFTSCSPSYFRLLVSSRHLSKLHGTSLSTLLLGGEQCSVPDIRKLKAVTLNTRVYNRYGPTEATIAVTTHEVTTEDLESGWVPLGRPHEGVEFFLVGADRELISNAGEDGELYIAGEQLMSRYWGDNEATRRVLRSDVVPGKVLYKTGDLVRQNHRGDYLYRGRLDDVIKRNGVRLSLTEICHAIQQAKGVRGATCVLMDLGGRAGIAAFVEAGPEVTGLGLLEVARQLLPANALPDEVFVVSTFPLTGQGKLDHRRLLSEAGRRPWQTAP